MMGTPYSAGKVHSVTLAIALKKTSKDVEEVEILYSKKDKTVGGDS